MTETNPPPRKVAADSPTCLRFLALSADLPRHVLPDKIDLLEVEVEEVEASERFLPDDN